MTLVVSAINSRFVTQVSDRRLTYAHNQGIFYDNANKMVIVENLEGVFAIGYSGIAYIGEELTDRK